MFKSYTRRFVIWSLRADGARSWCRCGRYWRPTSTPSRHSDHEHAHWRCACLRGRSRWRCSRIWRPTSTPSCHSDQQHPRRPHASETPGYYPDGPTRSVHLPQPRGTRALKQLCSEAESVLRVLERSLDQLEGNVGELCDSNVFTLRYLRTASS